MGVLFLSIGFRRDFDRSNKAISSPGHSLEKLRIIPVIFQGGADLADGEIQALLEIDKCLRSPNLLRQFVAADGFACATDEQHQDLGRLGLKLNEDVVAASSPVRRSRWKSPKRTAPEKFDAVTTACFPVGDVDSDAAHYIAGRLQTFINIRVSSLINNSGGTQDCQLDLRERGAQVTGTLGPEARKDQRPGDGTSICGKQFGFQERVVGKAP